MTFAFVPFATRAFRHGLQTATATTTSSSSSLFVRRGVMPCITPERRVSVRMQCTPTGQVPDLTQAIMDNMERKIKDELSPTRLQIIPTIGDPNGAHVEIEVVSEGFEGMNMVKRHRKVYQVIWEELSGPVHAVDRLVTKTPTEDGSS